jgi:ATP/maltotriose-dependent transcriptional regulator MalT
MTDTALQTIKSNFGQGVLTALQSPGGVNVEIILIILINEIAEFPDDVILILDDYHMIETQAIDQAMLVYFGKMGWDSLGVPSAERLSKLNLENFVAHLH